LIKHGRKQVLFSFAVGMLLIVALKLFLNLLH
jgi:hypothetical protein